MWQTFGKYLKEASVLIIILALTKQLVYYNNFNIPISYFLGFSEIWLLITDDMFYLLGIILVFLWGFETIRKNEQSKLKIGNKKPSIIEKVSNVILKLMFLGYAVYGIIVLFMAPDYTIKVNGAIAALLCTTIFLTILKIDNPEFSLTGFAALSIVIIFTVVTLKINFKIKSVENGKYKGTIIKTADSTYISTDSSFSIGKTEHYVFIYNKKDSSTEIIPTETIIKMKLKSR
ncbi:hypothetical protein [Ferruginibacter sp.]|nr:hypothetical protein [Ferruginibacter sp.]